MIVFCTGVAMLCAEVGAILMIWSDLKGSGIIRENPRGLGVESGSMNQQSKAHTATHNAAADARVSCQGPAPRHLQRRDHSAAQPPRRQWHRWHSVS